MNETEIINLIRDIQSIIAIQNESLKQVISDNLDLKKRVEDLERNS